MPFAGKKFEIIIFDSEELTFALELDYDIESRQPFIETATLVARNGRQTLEYESDLWFAHLTPDRTRAVWDRLYRTLNP